MASSRQQPQQKKHNIITNYQARVKVNPVSYQSKKTFLRAPHYYALVIIQKKKNASHTDRQCCNQMQCTLLNSQVYLFKNGCIQISIGRAHAVNYLKMVQLIMLSSHDTWSIILAPVLLAIATTPSWIDEMLCLYPYRCCNSRRIWRMYAPPSHDSSTHAYNADVNKKLIVLVTHVY